MHVYRRAEKGRQVKGEGRTGLSDERVHRPSRPIAKRRLPQTKSSTANLRFPQSVPESASTWRLRKLPGRGFARLFWFRKHETKLRRRGWQPVASEWGRAAPARCFFVDGLDVVFMSEISQLLRDSPIIGADSESSTRAFYRDPRDRDLHSGVTSRDDSRSNTK